MNTPFPRDLTPTGCPWFVYDKKEDGWDFVIPRYGLWAAHESSIHYGLDGKGPQDYPGIETLVASVAAMYWDIEADKHRNKLVKDPGMAYTIDAALRKALRCREWLKNTK